VEDIYLNCFEAQQLIFAVVLGLTQTQASISWLHALPTDCVILWLFFLPYISCTPDSKARPYSNMSSLSPHSNSGLNRVRSGFSWPASTLQQACKFALSPTCCCQDPNADSVSMAWQWENGKYEPFPCMEYAFSSSLTKHWIPKSTCCSVPLPSSSLENVPLELWPHSGNFPSPRTGRALEQGNICLEGQLKASHCENFGFLWPS